MRSRIREFLACSFGSGGFADNISQLILVCLLGNGLGVKMLFNYVLLFGIDPKSIPIFIGIFDKKDQVSPIAPPAKRPTHKDPDNLKFVYMLAVEGRRLRYVLCEATGGAAFSLALFILGSFLLQAKKRRWSLA